MNVAPIQTGVYLTAENSCLELQANNIETGIITKIPCNSEATGVAVVEGKRLLEVVKKVDAEIIKITVDDEKHIIEVSGGKSKFKLLTMYGEDFLKVTQIGYRRR